MYSQATFRVSVSSVVMLLVKLTLQVTLVPWCSAEGLKVNVELRLCVTPVMFPVMWESFSPAPLHLQVISGSEPEQRPGAVQVSVAFRPSVRGGISTEGFWVRAEGRAVYEWNQVTVHLNSGLNNLIHLDISELQFLLVAHRHRCNYFIIIQHYLI